MRRIKLNFTLLSIPDKINKARQIVTALTGNLDFPTPSPALASITAAIGDLETAHVEVEAARQTARSKTSAQAEKEDALDRLMSKLTGYVESIGAENEELLRSVGMDARAVASKASDVPNAPSRLEVTAGIQDGEVQVSWDRVPGARSYIVEKSPDPPTLSSWSHAAVATKSRATVSGLTPGTRYWFHVAAVGPAGRSGWSDPGTRIAT